MEELPPLEQRAPLFTSQTLLRLIIPLIIERFLDMSVGVADTFMVSSVGEAAVSGVSLVDNISNLIIFVLAALSTGGAVVISQYMGRGEGQHARTAAKQLLYATTFFATAITAAMLIAQEPLLHFLIGEAEADVMANAMAYFRITALSFPFIAIFNSAAALYRSMGNSKVSMYTSLLMNIINIGGNAWLIYGMNLGAAGAALASLASRMAAAVMMLVLLRNPRNSIHITHIFRFEFHPGMVKNIMRVGIPNGIENGIFHVGRLFVQSLITTFGTASIAANAVAGRVMTISQVPGSAIQLAIITVVGQCIGAGDYRQAETYAKRLMKYVYVITGSLCVMMYFTALPAMELFRLSEEATRLGVEVIHTSSFFIFTIWPMAFPFGNVIRAAGDTRFTMIVSIISMLLVRVGGSYLLHSLFGLGLMGVWYAMYADWLVRSVFFILRFRSGKWKTKQVIRE
ncbi:MATE family efflux transporter [Christensenellaceae bacterium OttesenSCG-928-L17]|nr:MATE family efflux transporter [Christensenellaceae bacterium OttesenSCG-928-L17]